MTCIAAVAADGRVWMGGDSAGVDERFSLQSCDETKVWRSGEFLFGMSGSYRAAQLVRYQLTLPVDDGSMEARAYITGPFVDALRNVLADGGALTNRNGHPEEFTDSAVLVGYRGRLYEVMDDFGVGETSDGFAAIGSGYPWALGAMAATPDLKPRRRVLTALKASERFCAAVRRPFIVESL